MNPIFKKITELLDKESFPPGTKEQLKELLAIAEKENESLTHSLAQATSESEILSEKLNANPVGNSNASSHERNRDNTLQQALESLKVMQDQLIQSEKMSSLGELTAGIAHEVQNPLNFINNFSEINADLVEELRTAILKKDFSETDSILDNIRENEKKIAQHGKRADSIVKNMLIHSRSNSGNKELVDINHLAEEYLRLSYHGMRAKDKSFNATMKNDFDPAVGKVSVVTQDLGRVMLNLINNAFYAVLEKSKSAGTSEYHPEVQITTMRTGGEVQICIRDNGTGIPVAVRSKIFQPFFTTKPTGAGTGLGLSLSYEIIRNHGGDITVDTEERKGTKFVIHLPAGK